MQVGTPLVVLVLLAFGLSLGLTRYLLRSDTRLSTTALPNHRSLHDAGTPTGGGLSIIAAVLVFGAMLALSTSELALVWIGLAAALVAGVSFIDDRRPLSPVVRLGIHVLAAAVLITADLLPDNWSYPGGNWLWYSWMRVGVGLIFIVWMTNLYNFMDGMDGFAGGMSVIGFSTFAVLGYQAGNLGFFGVSALIASASAGFLVFNFPPARIFMGDVGASSLGVLAAALIMWAERDQVFPFWIGVLVFSPFVVDATVTLLVRCSQGQRFWEAHRTHCYQRLVRSGWSHRRTVSMEYGLMVLCSLCALFAITWQPAGQWFLLSGWVLTYTVLMSLVFRVKLDRS